MCVSAAAVIIEDAVQIAAIQIAIEAMTEAMTEASAHSQFSADSFHPTFRCPRADGVFQNPLIEQCLDIVEPISGTVSV